MSARERECGGLPSPDLSLLDRKVRQGLIRFGDETSKSVRTREDHAGWAGRVKNFRVPAMLKTTPLACERKAT